MTITASRRLPGLLGALALGAAVLASGASARESERLRQKHAAESERAELQQKLDALKRDMSRTESARSHAADSLAQSESAISQANRALRDLDDEHRRIEARISQLADEQDRIAKAVSAQQKRLSLLLRDQYAAGGEDRIKLLLSGDNPNRINRDLQYMGYVSKAQARLLEALRANLAAIEANKFATQEARDELDEVVREQREQMAVLEKEKKRHAALVAQLSGKLAAQRKEVGGIERDEQRLGVLVDRLGRLIEEQRRAEAEAAKAAAARAEAAKAEVARAAAERQEKLRQDQLAQSRAKAQPPVAGKMSSVKTKPANPDAIDNDEPPKTVARNELAPEPGVQSGLFSREFGSLRGQLRLPVKGDLIAKFGGKRGDGPAWKGLFIRAPEGSEIRAVAQGRVVFADWLRGFGNLIILDHGGEYLTIYGNNQAVLKHAGDLVKTGEVIASAGNSGGNEQSGLYFEMRHQGRAFDPLGWVTVR
ncbi:murein hydrolase activator EnvC family protein [Noviherbaspirillum galbum]|uniref:Peptidoglycan DD-metalloendopeptidase family protein n=1 Tax=Noviherbaspirillum galbum TaxID=2709383 RepID=A0A6B3SPX8_9BURK|nr:peptidoglycan DD-metalloendopeptidase family protein [Noviherbaspirillum galbum]NEX61365.1 peptidoglycan DD-metalloendopeptidase family protein [Noviherbaspirillum galbum]